jgi:hypothetical protein
MMTPRFKECKKDIRFPVFLFTVTVIISNDILRSRKKLDRIVGYPMTKGNPQAMCTEYGPGLKCFLIFRPGADVDTFVHECWHAVFFMMNTVGVKIDHETVAHHMGYLSQQVYDFFEEQP